MKLLQQIFKAVEEYSERNPDLSFGQIIDDVVAVGSSKALPYISNEEMVEMLNKANNEKGLITAEALNKLRVARMKDYHKGNLEMEREPKSLFIDGEFNGSNYFGGDDIIRMVFTHMYQNPNYHKEIEFEVGQGKYNLDASISLVTFTNRVALTVSFSGERLQFKSNGTVKTGIVSPINGHAWIDINKDESDSINGMSYNGESMDEVQYIFILNIIKALGFNFTKGEME